MRIFNIIIEDKTKEKILYKHGITSYEIKKALFNNPLILKTKDLRYLALSFYQKYITIVFEVKDNIALIITAYPSSDAQRNLYKLKRG